jgi:hypothetical protein
MEKITDILFSQVEDENGKSYGRVFELRSDGEPEHGETSKSRRITEFLCGTTGILQQFGFAAKNVSTIDWEQIVDIKPGRIVIRPPDNRSD